MNIVYFTHGKVNPFGESGMSRTVYYLNKYLKRLGNNSYIWSVVDGIRKHMTFKRNDVTIIEMFPRIHAIRFRKKSILNYVEKNRDIIDLVHIHMMWMYDKNILAKTLKKLKIPYIITSHAAYIKDRIKSAWWKKLPAKYLYELRFLNNAAAIHALCHEEMTSLREFGVKSPIFVVPNGIELEETPRGLNCNSFDSNLKIKGKIRFSWVGNLKPCKNLDGLIRAVALIPENVRNKLALMIIGPEGVDAKSYLSYLRRLTEKHNVNNLFHFMGGLYGKNKYDALASSDIYIHPSWSEGISFAILEAMACAKPCIITRTSNIAYLYKYNFFTMTEPYPEDIARGMIEMLNRRDKWREMGDNARKLIESELTWKKITREMIRNYQEVVQNYRSKNG